MLIFAVLRTRPWRAIIVFVGVRPTDRFDGQTPHVFSALLRITVFRSRRRRAPLLARCCPTDQEALERLRQVQPAARQRSSDLHASARRVTPGQRTNRLLEQAAGLLFGLSDEREITVAART